MQQHPPDPSSAAVAFLSAVAETQEVEFASDLALRHHFLRTTLQDDPIGYYQAQRSAHADAIERERIALAEAGAAEWTLEPVRWRVEAHDERSDALVVRSAVVARAFGSHGVAIAMSLEDGEVGPAWRFAGLRRAGDVADWAPSYEAAAAGIGQPIETMTAAADDYWGADSDAPDPSDRRPADDFWAGTEDEPPDDLNVAALEEGMRALWRLYGAAASGPSEERRRTFMRLAERVAAS